MDPSSGAASNTVDSVALLPLPSLGELSEQQIRGMACVWCAVVLGNGTAVDLGTRTASRAGQPLSWFPRACRQCAAAQAWQTLLGHGSSCEQCVDNADLCETGRALYRLVREYRR